MTHAKAAKRPSLFVACGLRGVCVRGVLIDCLFFSCGDAVVVGFTALFFFEF